jgi:hypothetical protein
MLGSMLDYVRFEVFTVATMKNAVFWTVTPCSSCKSRRFGELSASIIRVTSHNQLHLRRRNLHSHRLQNLKSYINLTGWSLLRRGNVYPVRYELGFYIPAEGILHSHRRENLKSYIILTGWARSGQVMCLF